MSASGRVGVDVVVLASVVLGLLLLGVLLGGTDELELVGVDVLGLELLDDGGTELLELLELLDGGTEEELLGDELELLDELDDDTAELLGVELELLDELATTDDDGVVVSGPRSVAPATGPAIRPRPARARPNPATTAPTFVTRSMLTSRLPESCRTPQICQFGNGSHSPCRNEPKSPRRA